MLTEMLFVRTMSRKPPVLYDRLGGVLVTRLPHVKVGAMWTRPFT